MNQKKILILVIPIVVYLIFFIYSDSQKILYNIVQIKPELFLMFIIFWSLAVVCRIIRWHVFMRKTTTEIPFKMNVIYYLSGYSMLLSPGRIGEVVKSSFIKRDYGISISKTASIVFVERFYDLLASIVIISIAISFTTLPKSLLAVPLGMITMMIIIMSSKRIFSKMIYKLGKIQIFKNMIPSVDESFEIIFSLIKSKVFPYGIGLTMSVVFFEAVAVYYLVESFGYTLDFASLTAIFHISNFLAAASMIPGGLGILEGSFSGLLILFHIPKDISFSITILIRIVATGLFSIVGLFFLRIVSKSR